MKKTLLVLALVVWSGLLGVVSAEDPRVVSICDIQMYNGVQQGERVQITGVCTAETGRYGDQATMIAESDSPYCCGMMVFVVDADLIANRGECVTAVGLVQEYYDKTELYIGTDETIRPSTTTDCYPVPDPIIVKTSEAMQEQYESCILETHCDTLTTNPDDFGLFSFKDDQEPSGEMYGLFSYSWEPQPASGDFFCRMTGMLDYSWSTFRLRPRDQENDLDTTPKASCSLCQGTPPPPCEEDVVVTLTLNKEQPNCFIANDTFSLTVSLFNPCPPRNIDEYCVLDVFGQYFFYPTWTQDLQKKTVALPDNGTYTETVLEFIWPQGAGMAQDLTFYFACMDEGTLTLASNLDLVNFCFQ